ncbi:MAG: energy transducer TonB [Chitinophagaceae bacterium]|nr:energy transducer TonB [Chitinophagaceae bacterium]
MKLFFCLCFTLGLFSLINAQETARLYTFNSDWTPAKSMEVATYFMTAEKENDTLYACRYYNMRGPMILWESYKDSALEKPNGLFAWYDKKGKLDSLGQVHNGKKDGEWTYGFSDSGEAIITKIYEEGVLQKTINHTSKLVLKSGGDWEQLTNEIIDTTDQHPAEFTGGVKKWGKFLEKNLITPKRFMSISGPNSHQTVTVSFRINPIGEVCNIFIINSCEWSADMEVIRILKISPKWIPSTIKGKPVPYNHKQNITFQVGY